MTKNENCVFYAIRELERIVQVTNVHHAINLSANTVLFSGVIHGNEITISVPVSISNNPTQLSEALVQYFKAKYLESFYVGGVEDEL